jgi:subtilisin family serine protease
MAMPKPRARNVVHLLIVGLFLAGWQGLYSQGVRYETVTVDGFPLEIVSGKVHVRMVSKRTVEEVNAILPEGFRVDHHFLPPERTEHFLSQSVTRPPSEPARSRALHVQRSALRDAEDRLTRTFTIAFEGRPSVSAAIAYLLKTLPGEVEIAEPWTIDRIQGQSNDSLRPLQDYLQTIGFDQAWEVFKGADTIIIGISDDWIDQRHEDLSGNIAANAGEIPGNGKDDDANGYVDDYRGHCFAWPERANNTTFSGSFNHGTRVAGLAAASTNNGKGIASAGMSSRFFPMAVAGLQGGGIMYGYQSLIYAAERGFDVVNTSWGTVKPASAIDQSVIDFCLAKNVLVVASGGNHGEGLGGTAFNRRNYPSAYDGVLGVGETTPDDFVVGSSGLGGNADLMAPGNLALTTEMEVSGGNEFRSEYTSSGTTGTSFASPIVAGAAAVVRARWPQLTARQVAAHLRATAVDISSLNPSFMDVVAPRLNLFKAVTEEPLSRPSMRISAVRQSVAGNGSTSRFRVGDTLLLQFEVTNDLGPATAELEPRIVSANGWALRGLRERDALGQIATGASVSSKPFPFVIDAIGSSACVVRVEILGDTYQDHAFHYINLPSAITRFENEAIMYSMSDDGMVGYTSIDATRQGAGFARKPATQLLSPSGLFVVDDGARSVTGYKNDPPLASDFVATKPFGMQPQPNTCRMIDSASSAPLDVEVTQTCLLPRPNLPATIWNVTITPRSATLPSVAAGYVLDWDVSPGGRNDIVTPDQLAIPSGMQDLNVAAQRVTLWEGVSAGAVSHICVAVVSNDPDDRAQSAGLPLASIIDDNDGFTHRDRVALLSAGISRTPTLDRSDVFVLAGMRRTKPLEIGQSWTFSVIITVGADSASAQALMREVIPTVSVTGERESASALLQVDPNPVTDIATVRGASGPCRCSVIDMLGRVRMSWQHAGVGEIAFDASQLEKGAYTLRIDDEITGPVQFLRFLR